MALETEAKVRITQEDLDSLRAGLRELGASCRAARQKEDNWLFDFPDKQLREAGCALRLRVYGEETLLTFKGKTQIDPRFKKREELETQVGDSEKLKKILQHLGLSICSQYSKYREIYQLHVDQATVDVCLDETPAGTFVEIEGPAPEIVKLAAQLGWTPDSFIQENYLTLYEEAGLLTEPR
ncbi:MAG: class IV adenylate cyclase [Acidobacteriota bacterium]